MIKEQSSSDEKYFENKIRINKTIAVIII